MSPSQKKEKWYCNTILLTYAKEGGFLLPHRDVVSKNSNNEESFNVGLFLDGNNDNPYNSGALGLYEDNEFKKPIFVPNNLKNTILDFDTKKNFMHGFPTIAKNCFRKTINIGFEILIGGGMGFEPMKNSFFTRFPSVRLQPLGHLSIRSNFQLIFISFNNIKLNSLVGWLSPDIIF